MLICHKGHTDTIQVYSVTVMTHVKALQAGHSSQGGTSEPIRGGGGGKGGYENVRPENNFSKNREREITFTEIREREIRT